MPTWIKTKDRLPGVYELVKWRDGNGVERPVKETVLQVSYVRPSTFEDHEWLDESPTPAPSKTVEELAENYVKESDKKIGAELPFYGGALRQIDYAAGFRAGSSVSLPVDGGLLERAQAYIKKRLIETPEGKCANTMDVIAICVAQFSLLTNPSPLPVSIVEQLEKYNPWTRGESEQSFDREVGYNKCLSKLRELIATSAKIAQVQPASVPDVKKIKQEAQTELIWAMIEENQDSDEGDYSKNDIELELYGWFEKLNLIKPIPDVKVLVGVIHNIYDNLMLGNGQEASRIAINAISQYTQQSKEESNG